MVGPGEEQFGFHLAQVRELGGYLCGRRLYQTMLVREADPSRHRCRASTALYGSGSFELATE